MTLTSSQNPLLQSVRRAVEEGRPLPTGQIAAEGPHLLTEALQSRWQVERIFCSTESLTKHSTLLAEVQNRNIEVTEVSARAFRTLSDTEHDQGVVCLLRPPVFDWPDLLVRSGPIVILDGVQDPGNAGTIFRSAEAFGAAGLILTEGCVRISNGKLLRAGAGSLFRMPLIENIAREKVVTQIGKAGRRLLSLTARGQSSLFEVRLVEEIALVVGNEGSGVSETLLAASQALSIPMERVESLNASVACSVALFEAARQRKAQI